MKTFKQSTDNGHQNHKTINLTKLLDGLGKPTKRGIRECPKCGFVNGLRGFQCKNKNCGFRFRNEIVQPAKSSFDVDSFLDTDCKKTYKIVQLACVEKIYSVEKLLLDDVQFEKENWGFVHLPLCEQTNNKNFINDVDTQFEAFQLMAYCYMINCGLVSKTNTSSNDKKSPLIKKRKRKNVGSNPSMTCDHIKAAFLSDNVSIIFPINPNVLDMVFLPMEPKIQLTKLLADQSDLNVIVQKVSDFVFVIKCHPDIQHPLGFSHVHVSGISDESETTTEGGKSNDDVNDGIKKGVSLKCWCGLVLDLDFFKDSTYQPCIFLFACLLALSSSSLYNSQSFALLSAMDEYYNQVNMVQESMFNVDTITNPVANGNDDPVTSSEDVFDYLKSLPKNEDQDEEVEKVETSEVDKTVQPSNHMNNNNENKNLNPTNNNNNNNNIVINNNNHNNNNNNNNIHRENLFFVAQFNNNNNNNNNNNFASINSNNKLTSIIKINAQPQLQLVSQQFDQWLLFVIESIHESMHYQCLGTPPPLHVSTPQHFFDVIQDRISHFGIKKKRLPDAIVTITRQPPDDDPPFGQFLQYKWNLKSSKHVQSIFYTPLGRLDLTQVFIENKDGSYSKFEPMMTTTSTSTTQDENLINQKPTIRPLHMKTQLEIGFNAEYKSSKSFIIEWIPDLYVKSKTGRMTLKYEFSHYKCTRADETIQLC